MYLVLPMCLVFSSPFLSLIALEAVTRHAHLAEVCAYTICFGCFLYIALGEWFTRGAVEQLTIRRGEKWVKEMDYVFVLLVAPGVFFGVFRATHFAEQIQVPDLLTAGIVVAGLVVRLLQTRAEVEGWAKLSAVVK